jgi:membrane-associated phospholipid phosphatase
MNSLTMTIASLDKEILLTLNSFGGGNKDLWTLSENSLFRGFPLFFSLPALWFSSDHRERRGRMLAGLLAVCLATILSVCLQFHFAVHTRPILDPALHLETAIPNWTWDRTSSFPSDTATLYFGLSAVIFAEERWIGLFCFVWVATIIAIPRVIFGFHYASDIIGSLVLGPVCVFIFTMSPYPRRLFERTLIFFEGRIVRDFLAMGLSMLQLDHVWTAPWQELSDVLQHWSGAVTCPTSHDDSSFNGFLPTAIRGELSCCRASLLTAHQAGW